MDVVILEDHRVGGIAPGLPEGAAVEAGERAETRLHVSEATDPDEAVRLAHDLELAQRVHALVPLGAEEMLLGVANEVARLARCEAIVPQLDHLHRNRSATRRAS